MMWSSCDHLTLIVLILVAAAGLGLGTGAVSSLTAVAVAFCRWDFHENHNAAKADDKAKQEAD
jgi:hypothetical protein